MTGDQSVFDITSKVLAAPGTVFTNETPALVLVQGDATTVCAAALAAFYLDRPVGHIEAGSRTFDKRNPLLEEMNRRLTSALADFHFAPTETIRRDLLREGVSEEKVYVAGNTVVDVVLGLLSRNYSR